MGYTYWKYLSHGKISPSGRYNESNIAYKQIETRAVFVIVVIVVNAAILVNGQITDVNSAAIQHYDVFFQLQKMMEQGWGNV